MLRPGITDLRADCARRDVGRTFVPMAEFETEDAALRAVEAVGATAETWIMAGHRARRVISLSSLSGARYH